MKIIEFNNAVALRVLLGWATAIIIGVMALAIFRAERKIEVLEIRVDNLSKRLDTAQKRLDRHADKLFP